MILTDDNGDWELFVPYNSTWQIEPPMMDLKILMKQFRFLDLSSSVDLELIAGLVDVYGNITYDLGISSIPVEEIILEIFLHKVWLDTLNVEIEDNDGAGWSGSWSAELEPDSG